MPDKEFGKVSLERVMNKEKADLEDCLLIESAF